MLKARIPPRKEVEEQMIQYLYQLKFQGEDSNMWKKEAILAEVQDLIQEHLEVEDLNLLKAGKLIHHERQMVIWRFQMQATSRQIKDYYRQNGSIMGMIFIVVRKTLAFLEETMESYDLTDEEWNSAGVGSNLP